MFCGHCGVNNADQARFCASCGKPLGAAAPPPHAPPPRGPPPRAPYAPPPQYSLPPAQYVPPPAQPQHAPYAQQPPYAQPPAQQPQFATPPGAQFAGAPMPPPPGAPRANIATHFVLAIVTTVLCCLPFGVIGIVYASQVKSKLAVGDIAGATAASGKAKLFSILGMVIGLIGMAIYGATIAVQLNNM